MSDFKTGSVISGTHRLQDILPKLLDELRERNPTAYAQLCLTPFGPIPSHAMEDENADWWEGDDPIYLYDELITELDYTAPEGYYFGTHPGDGSDYGFWNMEDES